MNDLQDRMRALAGISDGRSRYPYVSQSWPGTDLDYCHKCGRSANCDCVIWSCDVCEAPQTRRDIFCVKNTVWSEAGYENDPEYPNGANGIGTPCIRCFERKLGRKLTTDDLWITETSPHDFMGSCNIRWLAELSK